MRGFVVAATGLDEELLHAHKFNAFLWRAATAIANAAWTRMSITFYSSFPCFLLYAYALVAI
jgi:hypothetical protein